MDESCARCNCKNRRFTGGESRFLQEADCAKLVADVAVELCGIALNNDLFSSFTPNRDPVFRTVRLQSPCSPCGVVFTLDCGFVTVRIRAKSLKTDNPNLFPIGDGFGLFVYFGQAPGRYYSRKAKPKPLKAPEKAVPKRRGRPPKYPRDPVVTE